MMKSDSIKKWIRILICFFICLQLFPPILVLDSTSLRHFLIALFDITAIGFVVYWTFAKKESLIKKEIFTSNPLIPLWTALIAFMGISIFWSINSVEAIAVWNRWLLIFVAMILCTAFMYKDNRLMRYLIVCTIVLATINVISCIACYYAFDVHISQRNNLKINGFYGNKNIFAVALLFKLPFLYYGFLRFKGWLRYLCLGLVFGIAFCLVIISTRSTFLGLFFQIGLLGLFALRNRSKISLLIIAVALAGFFAGDGFLKYNFNKFAKIEKNNYSIEARVGSIAEGNSKGRLLIWENTLEIIKDKPLLGYGVGNHKLAIMKVECAKKHDYVVSDHAHNDFLEMFSELGIIGILLYVGTYIVFVIIGLKQMFRCRFFINRLFALVALSLLITYANDALFNFPLERADCQIYLVLAIAILLSNALRCSKTKETQPINKALLIGLATLVVACFVVEGMHCYSSALQKLRIKQHNGDKSITYTPEDWERKMPCLPNIDESTKPIAVNVAERYANVGNYRKAIDILLEDNSNPYYSLREYRLSNYYGKMGNKVDSATYWANKCIAMKPLCYSPVRVLINIEGKKGNWQGQLKLIDEYLERYQLETLAWEDKVNVLLKRNQQAEALETVKKARKYMPHSPKMRKLEKKVLDFSLCESTN